jgi:hypothetical protein
MRTLLVLAVLGGLLAASVGVSVYMWNRFGDVEMSGHGVLALVGGAVLTLALGVGLMVLVFYSARSGHDERAHEARLDRDRD